MIKTYSQCIVSKICRSILTIFYMYLYPINSQEVDDVVWTMHWPGAKGGRGKRSTDTQMSLDEIEESQLEYDHELNLKSLQYAFDQLKVDENAEEADRVKRSVTRKPHMKRMKLTLNVGAFIRKAIRNGRDKTILFKLQGALIRAS